MRPARPPLPALLLLLALALLAGGCSKVDREGKPISVGRLRLRTFPSGAQVWIDGALAIEATPATLVLPEGRYHLRLQAPGAEPIERTIEIEAGEADDLTLNIPKPPEARVAVRSDVAGAEVRINGYKRGVTPLDGVITRPGPIDLTITTPDGRARSVHGQLAIGEQKLIEVLFDEIASLPEPPPSELPLESRDTSGLLTLGVLPDSEVFDEEGRSLGHTPIQRKVIPSGEHHLTLRSLDGRYEKHVLVSVEAGQHAMFRFQLRDEDQLPGWRPRDAGP